MRCRVFNCDSRKGDASKCSFFSFPRNDALAGKWVEFCRQNKPFNLDTSVICMKHFTEEDFQNVMQYKTGLAKRPLLRRNAVPTIFAPVSQPHDELGRFEVVLSDEGREYRLEDGTLGASTSPIHSSVNYNDDHQEVEVLKAEVEALKHENALLKKQIAKQITKLAIFKRKSEIQLQKCAKEVELLQKNLNVVTAEMGNMEVKLSSLFTNGQIRKLKTGSKERNWTEEDIAQSITLYAASPKAYRLLYKQCFPLPRVRTLQTWTKEIEISRGLIKPVFRLLAAATHMDEARKLCVLSFNEMKVNQSYFYNVSSESAPVNYVQVAMLRGLMAKWNQPIFYDFDCKMTSALLQSMLQKSKDCGFNVIAIVCDLGGNNKTLLNDLGVTENQPWFILNDQKVYVFADVPHLLKLLRNHFLDKGFLINGKPVKKEIILELLSIKTMDLTITHKISASNLTVAGTHCQKVQTAAKLFSHTVAQAIARAASLGHLQEQNWTECYKLFKTANDWFDVFNVRAPHGDSRKRCLAYGLALKKQDKILDEMTNLIKSMKKIGEFSLLPFQKGIIQTNSALKLMFEDIKARFNIPYVLTCRLNQDVLENFFDIIRSKNGLHDHPDQQEFKYRLRLYLLGHKHNKDVLVDSSNVEEDDTSDIKITQPPLTSILLKNLSSDTEVWPVAEAEFDDFEFDELEHLDEYICHRLKDDIPSTSFNS